MQGLYRGSNIQTLDLLTNILDLAQKYSEIANRVLATVSFSNSNYSFLEYTVLSQNSVSWPINFCDILTYYLHLTPIILLNLCAIIYLNWLHDSGYLQNKHYIFFTFARTDVLDICRHDF